MIKVFDNKPDKRMLINRVVVRFDKSVEKTNC